VRGLSRIVRSSERMARMISDVLDFAKGRMGGGFAMQPQRVNMHELCRAVIDELHVSNPERQLQLETRGDGWGEWDPDRVAQAVSNLVGNALQHGATETPVRARLSSAGDGVLLEVTNQGEPIPPEALPHLFEPFRKVRTPSARSEQKSVGLGLWIVNEIVRGHGGTVKVRSTAKDGTTFAVWWPRSWRRAEAGSAPLK
jgi:signal transduction histidine kinase